MDVFIRAFSVVGAISIWIILLTVFFKYFRRFKKPAGMFSVMTVKGFINEGRPVNVHLNTGKIYKGLRFVGFIDKGTDPDLIPAQFHNTLVCEKDKGMRVFIRTDAVRVIEEVGDVVGSVPL